MVQLHQININNIRDTQDASPSSKIGLHAAGITSYRRAISLPSVSDRDDSGRKRFICADIIVTAALDRSRKGAHMSRYIECIDEILSDRSAVLEGLAPRIAACAAASQGAERAEAVIDADYFDDHHVDGSLRFAARAVSDGKVSRSLVGVSVDGFSVCPCAQEMSRGKAIEDLLAVGFSEEQALKAVEVILMPSHSQRGRTTLMIGGGDVGIDRLIEIAENSSSAVIKEKLKRPDELEVVQSGHASPKFAEDSARDAVRLTADVFPGLPKSAFLYARRDNYESIHSHTASAWVCGRLADLIEGAENRYFSPDDWLYELFRGGSRR